MTASSQIREYIANIPAGEPFASSIFRSITSTDNIRQAMGRLVKEGVLIRVSRGIFAKPKHVESIGALPTDLLETVKVLEKTTGEVISIHGAEAARQLQLTTQVPLRPVFYTTGNTRTIKIANKKVQLRHVNPSKMIAPKTKAGMAISALQYLGRENVNIETIKLVKKRLTREEFQETLALSNLVPAWLADTFYHYQHRHNHE